MELIHKTNRYRLGLWALVLLMLITQPAMAAVVELSLADSVALALQSNADIKIAQSAQEKARWALKQTQSGKGLTIDFAHTDTHYSSPAVVGSESSENIFNNQLALTIPLYSGGKLENQTEQAKLELKVADLAVQAARQQLKQTVTTYYFNVLQYRNEVKVNQETVDNYAAHLQQVQAQYRIGTVAKADVLSSQVELANAQDNLIIAQNNLQLAMAKLNNAVGLPLDSQLVLKQDFQYERYSATMEECMAYALKHRTELDEYQAKVASAQADVKIAQSGYRPTVDFSLSQSWADKDFPGLNNSDWQATLKASVNLFDSGLNKAKVKQAEQAIDTAKEQARQQRDTVLLEVREAYLSLREAEKRISTKKVAVEQAEESLMIAEARYRLGVGTNLAVKDAVVALNQAKLNNNKALYDYNTSRAQLEKAMGIPVAEK